MRVSLPAGVLALSVLGFLTTWVVAPRQSLSGRTGALPASPAPRLPLASAAEAVPPDLPPLPHPPRSAFVLSQPYQIALTFDDGPHHLHTARLLQILAAHRVRATFFVNGCWLDPQFSSHSQRNRELLAQAFSEGHSVGNHTYHHLNLGRLPHPEQLFEIVANEQLIESVIGVRPYLFRPPYAVLTRFTTALLLERDYVVVRWNSAVPDELESDPQQIRNAVLRWLRHYRGGIVMLHDRNRAAVEATELILAGLAAENTRRLSRGDPIFRVVPLDSFLQAPPESGARGAEPSATQAPRDELR